MFSQLTDIRTIAEQTNLLALNAAINAKGHVDEMLLGLDEMNQTISSTMDKLNALNGDINQDANTAVRALQFEDLTTQIIGEISSTLERLDAVNHTLGKVCAAARMPQRDIDTVHQLQVILSKERKTSIVRDSPTETPAEGEIDLF